MLVGVDLGHFLACLGHLAMTGGWRARYSSSIVKAQLLELACEYTRHPAITSYAHHTVQHVARHDPRSLPDTSAHDNPRDQHLP